ncbi:RHS repeat-associated core domain-containing protein [Pseudomonas sp. Irchel s3h17]|uniref:RHS repeat-associated core domain-containing protein n=1 Tax=Pseudomonas sp. Irchel s3h17 TaxID=2009182 RepID=UPI000BA4BAC6|nr:RHS repeat-associated core domain-containing protein [Pseudomonas sp. Irchel s3h17]
MPAHRETLLCRYRYDPLDRLADFTPATQASTQRFYLKDRLATEIQGAIQRSILQHEDQLLAQQQRQNDTLETHLFATDQQRSVLGILDATRPHHLAYTPYGHRVPENGLLSLLGFNGERPDPVTGNYLLGNGYRAFSPVLMRFNSPDNWSPFGDGGLNPYAYCVGDPVNRRDPTGHTPAWLKVVLRSIGFMRSRVSAASNEVYSAGGAFRRSSSVDGPPTLPITQKTPAWTTQDRLAFSGTEARHPGAPRSATSQESLTSFSSDGSRTSDADIQPLSARQSTSASTPPRRRRGADVYDAMMDTAISDLRARYGNGNLTTNLAEPVFDPPPGYSQSFIPPPNYGAPPLPSFRQALVNAEYLKEPSKRQSIVRREN